MQKEVFQVELSPDVVPLISKRKQDTSQKIKEMVVIELFREGKISTGKAARILGMKRAEFISLLSYLQIPYFYQNKEELLKEASQA